MGQTASPSMDRRYGLAAAEIDLRNRVRAIICDPHPIACAQNGGRLEGKRQRAAHLA